MSKQRIEALAGGSIGPDASPDVIARLVEVGAAEHSDLEFKRQLWDRGDAGREELAKDVTALANAVGGLIIVGIATVNDVASAVMPFPVGDQQAREVLTVVASRVFPHPYIECYPVSADGVGYLVVDVPASPLAPHAVWDRQRGTLKYPVRTGTQTHYLTEADVAERYTQRSWRLERRPDAAAEIERELVDDMDLIDGPVLVVSVVPTTTSAHPLTREFLDDTARWWRSQIQETFSRGHGLDSAVVYAAVGFGRVELGVSHQGPRRFFAAHLYADGRVAIGQSAFHQRQGSDGIWEILDVELAQKIVDQLAMCSSHLERLGIVGFADVRLSIVDRQRSGDVGLSQYRYYGYPDVAGRLPDARDDVYPTCNAWTDTSSLSAPVGQATLTHRLGSQLVSAFGVAELMPFGPTGAVRLDTVPQAHREAFRGAARRCQIPVDE